MDISIVIATCHRRLSLRDTIASIQAAVPDQVSCELVVASNGDDAIVDVTNQGSPLYVRQVHERKLGKSRALNRALETVSGALVVFTDDDVIVSPKWLKELHRASYTYIDEAAFCGPITPEFPANVPAWLRQHPLAGGLFARFEPSLNEGYLPMPLLPFGPNFAIRAEALRDMHFRLDLGPSEENGPLLCEDTEFAAEVRDRLSITTHSGGYVYLPEAAVTHRIGEHKLAFPWMMERFFFLGRSRLIRFRRVTHICRRPRLLCGEINGDPGAWLSAGAELNFYAGQAYQAQKAHDQDRASYLTRLLEVLHIDDHKKLWSLSMREWLKGTGANPEMPAPLVELPECVKNNSEATF